MGKYRYITCGIAVESDPAANFRLISSKYIKTNSNVIRIEIPADMKLNKLSCDCYSTTEDHRTLADLRAIPMIKVNGRWRLAPSLRPYPIHEWCSILREKHGLISTIDNGYETQEQFSERVKKIFGQKL